MDLSLYWKIKNLVVSQKIEPFHIVLSFCFSEELFNKRRLKASVFSSAMTPAGNSRDPHFP